jgi:hypothetical protein
MAGRGVNDKQMKYVNKGFEFITAFPVHEGCQKST